MTTPRIRLGQLLVDARLIAQEALDEALAIQRGDGRRLGTLLVERGFINEIQLTQILSHQLAVPWVSLLHIEFTRPLLDLVPRDIAEKYCLVPIYVRHVRRQGDTLYVAMDDPTNEEALRACSSYAGLPVRAMIAPPSDIGDAIRAYYGASVRPPRPATITDPPSTQPDLRGGVARGAPGLFSEAPTIAVGEALVDDDFADIPDEEAMPSAEGEPLDAHTPDTDQAEEEEEEAEDDDDVESRPTLESIPPEYLLEASKNEEESIPSGRPSGVYESQTDLIAEDSAPPTRPAGVGDEPTSGVQIGRISTPADLPAPVAALLGAVLGAGPTAVHAAPEDDATSAPLPLPAPDATEDAPIAPIPPPRGRGRRRRMISLTLLDGTTITLPARSRAGRPSPPSEPPPEAPEHTPESEEPGLTARDLVAALRAVAQGADATEVLGNNVRWEPMIAAILSLLLKKHLIADWEFVEELKKMR